MTEEWANALERFKWSGGSVELLNAISTARASGRPFAGDADQFAELGIDIKETS